MKENNDAEKKNIFFTSMQELRKIKRTNLSRKKKVQEVYSCLKTFLKEKKKIN